MDPFVHADIKRAVDSRAKTPTAAGRKYGPGAAHSSKRGCYARSGKNPACTIADTGDGGRGKTGFSQVDPRRAWAHRPDRRPDGPEIFRQWAKARLAAQPG